MGSGHTRLLLLGLSNSAASSCVHQGCCMPHTHSTAHFQCQALHRALQAALVGEAVVAQVA
jgi:hypothetical protein